MRLGDRLVELYRSERRGFRFGPRYLGGQEAKPAQVVVRIGQPGPRRRVARILLHGSLEVSDALSAALFRRLVPLGRTPARQVITSGRDRPGPGTAPGTS